MSKLAAAHAAHVLGRCGLDARTNRSFLESFACLQLRVGSSGALNAQVQNLQMYTVTGARRGGRPRHAPQTHL
jgi:hypothetical protein